MRPNRRNGSGAAGATRAGGPRPAGRRGRGAGNSQGSVPLTVASSGKGAKSRARPGGADGERAPPGPDPAGRQARRRHFPPSGPPDALLNPRLRLRSTRECREHGGGNGFREDHLRNKTLGLFAPPASSTFFWSVRRRHLINGSNPSFTSCWRPTSSEGAANIASRAASVSDLAVVVAFVSVSPSLASSARSSSIF